MAVWHDSIYIYILNHGIDENVKNATRSTKTVGGGATYRPEPVARFGKMQANVADKIISSFH